MQTQQNVIRPLHRYNDPLHVGATTRYPAWHRVANHCGVKVAKGIRLLTTDSDNKYRDQLVTGESRQQVSVALYDRYKSRLTRYAGRLGSRDPEGVAHLAMVDLHRAMPDPQSRPDRSIRAYLYRSAHGHVVDELRRATPSFALEPSAIERHDRSVVADTTSQVVDNLVLADLVQSLTPKQRFVIEQLFFHDRAPMAIADDLGTTANAVNQIRRRALHQLRAALIAAAAVAALVLGAWLAVGRDRSLTTYDNEPTSEQNSNPTQSTPSTEGADTRPTTDKRQDQLVIPNGATTTTPTVADLESTPETTNTTSAAADSVVAFETARLDVNIPGTAAKPGWAALPAEPGRSVTVGSVTYTLFGFPVGNYESTGDYLDVNNDYAFNYGTDAYVGVRLSGLPKGSYNIETWHSDLRPGSVGDFRVEFGRVGGERRILDDGLSLSVSPRPFLVTVDGVSDYELFVVDDSPEHIARLNGLRVSVS